MTVPTLVAVAHGTRDPRGAETVDALLTRIRRLRPALAVCPAYLEIAEPLLADAVAEVDGPTVVVPLLLSPGYHSRVDIPGALAQRRPDALLGAVLGPDPALNEVLLERLQQAGWRAGEAVVLAAAGSSDPAGATATETQAQLLTEKTRGPVLAGYASAAAPDVPTAVAALRAAGAKRVAVATYLLAPGFFAGSVADSGADLVSEPLGPHDAIARLVLRRYDHALSAASTTV